MFLPNKMVMVSEARNSFLSTELSSLSGFAMSIAIGFDREVVSIKKVINKKAKSTIAVKSTLVLCFLVLTFLPFFPPPEVSNSAIIYNYYSAPPSADVIKLNLLIFCF
ncbi:hypothetical protein D3C72_2134580 [compost metagenome]